MTTYARIETPRDITVTISNGKSKLIIISDLKYLGDFLSQRGVIRGQFPFVEINGEIFNKNDEKTLLPTEPFEIILLKSLIYEIPVRIEKYRNINITFLNGDSKTITSDLKYLGGLLFEIGANWEPFPLIEINGEVMEFSNNEIILSTKSFEIQLTG
jgi:hypothetical protein